MRPSGVIRAGSFAGPCAERCGLLENTRRADFVIVGDDALLVPSDEIGAIPTHET